MSRCEHHPAANGGWGQAAAETALRQGVAAASKQGVQQGALVALDGEGRIRAYVGGAAYADWFVRDGDDFRTFEGHRQRPSPHMLEAWASGTV